MSRVTSGLFLPAVLLAFLLGPPAAKADTFVFNDLSETPTVSRPGLSPEPCGASEGCLLVIEGPAGATDLTTSGPVDIADPGGITLSDAISVDVTSSVFSSSPPGLGVRFVSDFSGESPLGPCLSFCTLTETGELQTAATVTWLGAGGVTLRTDTVEFVSDTDAVPEPASWLLVLTGLPLLGLRRLRRPPVGS
jgi:hypothetical protein